MSLSDLVVWHAPCSRSFHPSQVACMAVVQAHGCFRAVVPWVLLQDMPTQLWWHLLECLHLPETRGSRGFSLRVMRSHMWPLRTAYPPAPRALSVLSVAPEQTARQRWCLSLPMSTSCKQTSVLCCCHPSPRVTQATGGPCRSWMLMCSTCGEFAGLQNSWCARPQFTHAHSCLHSLQPHKRTPCRNQSLLPQVLVWQWAYEGTCTA